MTNPGDFTDRHVVIAGATSAIGRAAATALLSAGARVTLIGRETAALQALKKAYGETSCHAVQLDLLSLADARGLLEDSVERMGKFDGMLYAAGIKNIQPASLLTSADAMDMMKINAVAGFELARVVTAKKCRAEAVSLVFVASVAAAFGYPGLTGYCASKAALISGVKSLAIELAPRNIRVNCVSPGVVEQTGMSESFRRQFGEEAYRQQILAHPLGPGRPEDVANACLFLLSPAARWITATNLVVDGGYQAAK
ncbi:SDR family oxidoreductase [Desulfatiferula olefinivorans]